MPSPRLSPRGPLASLSVVCSRSLLCRVSTQNINNGNHGMDIDPPQAGSMPPEPMPQEDLPVEPPSSSGLARTAEIAKSSNSIQNDLSNSTDGNQKPVSSLISSTGLAKTAEIAKSSDSILKASTGAAPSSPLSKSQSSLRGSNANSAEAPIDFEPSLLPRSLLWKEDEKGSWKDFLVSFSAELLMSSLNRHAWCWRSRQRIDSEGQLFALLPFGNRCPQCFRTGSRPLR